MHANLNKKLTNLVLTTRRLLQCGLLLCHFR